MLSRAARISFTLAAAALAAPLVGCHSSSGPSGSTGPEFVQAIYTVPSSLDQLSGATFYDQPWPNDLRLQSGSMQLTGFYNPMSLPILDTYLTTMTGVIQGFCAAAAGYLRFDGAIDPSTLPATPKDGLDPNASVQLLNIEPTSPEYQQRMLCSLKFQGPAGVYYVSNTLAFMPTVGFPLRVNTRYALVVTDALKGANGNPVTQSPTISMLTGRTKPDSATSAAAASLSSAVAEFEKAGIKAEHIVHFAVYTTSDPTAELIVVRDGVAKTSPPPTADPNAWMIKSHGAYYTEYVGTFGPSPNYQAGTLPYLTEGGGFEFKNGLPVVQSNQTLRFSLMVPLASKCPMPATGYPIVLYAHGTGGDYESYVQDGTGPTAAEKCLATMGVDQIFQGTRPGSTPGASEAQVGLVFYNFQNPIAGRTNGRQSAIDEVQRVRLFTETNLTVPASVSVTGTNVLFDGTQILYFGHSQGGLNGPLFTAIDPSARGGVFSGSGAQIAIGLLDKTQPEPSVSAFVKTLLGLNATTSAELDIFHPAMSLLQHLTDVVDPLHYARFQFLEPRDGFAPKSVYMTEGINPDGTGDSYAPPPGIEAHALAMGLPLQLPFQHAIAQLAWGGPQPVTVPAQGLTGDLVGGNASGVLAQWAVPKGSDGHFVVFDVPAAQQQAAVFNANLAKHPAGLVPKP